MAPRAPQWKSPWAMAADNLCSDAPAALPALPLRRRRQVTIMRTKGLCSEGHRVRNQSLPPGLAPEQWPWSWGAPRLSTPIGAFGAASQRSQQAHRPRLR